MIPLYNIPDILYKYRIWDDEFQKRILTHNEVFLATPDMFNDPFDATLPFRYRDEDLTPENIYLKLYETAKLAWPNLSEIEIQQKCFERQNSGVFESDDYWKEEYEKFKMDVNKKFGILSLSANNDNMLMWSHYANSHHGFCVGFDKHSLFQNIRGQIGEIIYSTSIPRIPLNDNTLGPISLLLNTKSKNWEYENEYRITKINSPRQAYQLPNDAIKEIVLGMKMSDKNKNEIIEIAKSKLTEVNIYECQMNLDEFKIDLMRIY